ncbi:hypothetical protein [uncultured Brachyspira sp.]|uniref:hypothetical protein n=1 Tax=uncultured Brachyspira sp. TaxID=221953 RepID=UPI00263893BB|nr:hypothetical protein [uncultured Brachyspira sp.]
MRKLLTYITILLSVSSIAFAKIDIIKDDFNGTEYYQTKEITLSMSKAGFSTWGQIRFRTANGNKNIIIMDVAVSYTPNTVFFLDRLYIKYSNDYIMQAEPKNRISDSGINFTYYGSANEFILFQFILNDKSIEAIKSKATILRMEKNNSYHNLNVTKKEAEKMIRALDELLKFIDKSYKKI